MHQETLSRLRCNYSTTTTTTTTTTTNNNNNNSILYLFSAELNNQWPVTESARI
jgi:hypothetical protein